MIRLSIESLIAVDRTKVFIYVTGYQITGPERMEIDTYQES